MADEITPAESAVHVRQETIPAAAAPGASSRGATNSSVGNNINGAKNVTFNNALGLAPTTGEGGGESPLLDLRDENPPANNKFAFSPAQLHKLSTTRSLAALRQFGGLPGLAAGLRTNLAVGLSVDETTLDGTVLFDEVIAAGNERRPAAITPLPGSDQKTSASSSSSAQPASSTTAAATAQKGKGGSNGKDHFKLDLADLTDLAHYSQQPQTFADRRRVFGENKLPQRKQKSFLRLAWIAFNDKLMFLLTLSATISLALGIYETASASPEDGPKLQWVDGVTVVVAILVIVIASATTDWQKNRKFARLNERKEQRDVKVVRSGRTQNISVHELLVGDVMHIETGDVVAVDGVLIQGSGIQVDESTLSGESELVHKTAAPVEHTVEEQQEGQQEELKEEKANDPDPTPAPTPTPTTPGGGRKKNPVHRVTAADPFILSGTTVNGGVGSYLVISVGSNSTFGRTLMSIRSDVEETPLQLKLGKLAKQLITFGAFAGLIFFLIMFIRFLVRLPHMQATPSEKAMTFFKTLILAVTVVVVTVPEGLALAVTLALAFATSRMLKDNNLVRLIRSCEVMGNATCICSDKTGTLTQNVMTVVAGQIGSVDKFGDVGEIAIPAPAATSTSTGIDDATATEKNRSLPTSASKADADTEKEQLEKVHQQPEEEEEEEEGEANAVDSIAPPPSTTKTINPRRQINGFTPQVKTLIKDSIVVNTTAFESDDPNDANGGGGSFVGTSTETALLKFAREHLALGPLAEERANADIVDMFPFDASNKWMAVVCRLPSSAPAGAGDDSDGDSSDGGGTRGYRMYVKGAAEVVLERCSRTIADPTGSASSAAALATAATGASDGGGGNRLVSVSTEPLLPSARDGLKSTIRSFATRMLRPVALAYRDLGSDPTAVFVDPKDPTSIDFQAHFGHLTFVGVFGIRDPLRPEVVDSVRQCQDAGVFVRMVTGDNFLTAKAIASECGIYTAGGIAMDGPTFRRLSPEQLDRVVPRLQVLARSSPEDKLMLVSHLKERLGETVAVTGDGTNDALSLRGADVGFAMGIQGTEVAKESASIILLDDNFASIVRALSWGRTVNDAVRKFLQFQFTINITAGILTVVSELVGDSIFTIVQLLWLNLIMDIFASLGLATDYPSPDFLKRRPQPRHAPIVSVTMWKMILGIAVYELTVVFTLHYAGDVFFGKPANAHEKGQLQTMVFNVYVWMQFFNQHNCRRVDNRLNIWYQGVLRNPWFIGVQCATLAGQMVIIWKGGNAFDTVPLTGAQWGWSIALGMLVIPLGAALRCVPDEWAAAVFHAFDRVFVDGFVRVFVPARFSKRKRRLLLTMERPRSIAKSEDGSGGDAEDLGAMQAWVLHTGSALLRPVNYEWGLSHAPTSPVPTRHGISYTGRMSSIPLAQREALAAARRKRSVATAAGEVDLDGLVEASRAAAAAAAVAAVPEVVKKDVRKKVITAAARDDATSAFGLEVHPLTPKEDPVLLSALEAADAAGRRRKVPASQEPEVLRYLGSALPALKQ